jgi:hypothetical protein
MKKYMMSIALIFLLLIQIAQSNPVGIAEPEFNSQGYRSKEKLILDFDALMRDNTDEMSKISAGTTVMGNPIWMYKIGNPNSDGVILIDGGMHGSEYGGGDCLYLFANWLLNSQESTAMNLLKTRQFWLIPLLNYDFYNSMGDESNNGRYNANGVDLNRNFEVGWRQLHDSGPTPLSEPEAQVLHSLFTGGEIKAYINLHCGSNWLGYYPSSDPIYQKVLNNATLYAGEMGVEPYRVITLRGGGLSFSDAYTQGLQSWIFEFTSTWADQFNDGTYPTPPPYRQFQKTIFPRALPVFIAIAQNTESSYQPDPPTHLVTVLNPEGSGLTNPQIGNYSIFNDEQFKIYANASSEWLFDHWIINGTTLVEENPYKVTTTTDQSIKAVFIKKIPIIGLNSYSKEAIIIGLVAGIVIITLLKSKHTQK